MRRAISGIRENLGGVDIGKKKSEITHLLLTQVAFCSCLKALSMASSNSEKLFGTPVNTLTPFT